MGDADNAFFTALPCHNIMAVVDFCRRHWHKDRRGDDRNILAYLDIVRRIGGPVFFAVGAGVGMGSMRGHHRRERKAGSGNERIVAARQTKNSSLSFDRPAAVFGRRRRLDVFCRAGNRYRNLGICRRIYRGHGRQARNGRIGKKPGICARIFFENFFLAGG